MYFFDFIGKRNKQIEAGSEPLFWRIVHYLPLAVKFAATSFWLQFQLLLAISDPPKKLSKLQVISLNHCIVKQANRYAFHRFRYTIALKQQLIRLHTWIHPRACLWDLVDALVLVRDKVQKGSEVSNDQKRLWPNIITCTTWSSFFLRHTFAHLVSNTTYQLTLLCHCVSIMDWDNNA